MEKSAVSGNRPGSMAEFSIGVDLGGTNLRVAAYREQTGIFDSILLPTRLSLGRDQVVQDMCDAIRTLTERTEGTLIGIGIGSPGPLELPAGILRNPPNLPGWDGFHLRAAIESGLGRRVALESDANLAALAEWRLGAGVKYGVDSLCVLTLGTGVGSGLILNGAVWSGFNGMGGEAGHIIVKEAGAPCGCGGSGCLEQYASATAVVRMAREHVGESAPASAQELALLARNGNRRAQEVFDEVGFSLAIALTALINTLNLPLYLLGGGVSEAWDLFAPTMFQHLHSRSYVYRLTEPSVIAPERLEPKKTYILPAELGPTAGLLGACLLSLEASSRIESTKTNQYVSECIRQECRMQVSTSVSSRTAESSKGVAVFPTGQVALFVLVTVLFFLWGMSNNLTDILVRQFQKSFQLSQFSAQLVQTANFLGYFCMAIPAALVMRKWGYKAGMIMGLCFFGAGMVLFWPAAVSGSYVPFLVALFTVGCGASVLETAANPFMAQFGPAETSERRLNFAQSFNPPGTIVGVIIGARFIFSGIEKKPDEVAAMQAAGTYAPYLHTEIMRVVPTYLALGSVVLLFALLLSRMKFPSMHSEHEGEAGDHGSFGALLHYPHLLFAVVANFCNVGAQISTWSSLILYMKQYTNVSERTAAGYLTGTLVALMLGRFATTPLMKYISPSKLLGVYGAANVLLIALAITRPGMLGAYAIVATGFFLSIMFPTIFALGLKGLGPNTKLAGSLLVMAIVGGALFPLVLGYIARSTGSLALGYIVPLVGFAVVSIYGFAAPWILPPAGNTDPEAGDIVAERGRLI